MRLFLIGFLFTAICVQAATAVKSDAELSRLLVGTWVPAQPEKHEVLSTATYNADGTGTEVLSLRKQPDVELVRVTTHWSITNGFLVLKSVGSSNPSKIPIGVELKDRIITLTDDRLVYEAYEGYGEKNGTREERIRKK